MLCDLSKCWYGVVIQYAVRSDGIGVCAVVQVVICHPVRQGGAPLYLGQSCPYGYGQSGFTGQIFLRYFLCPLSLSFHPCCILIYISVTDAVYISS
jgi:hypothetical protein